MSTYEEKRTELEKRHIEQLAALERERDILQAIPPELLVYNWSVHVHRLWDQEASITLRPERYESIRKGPDPTVDTIRQMWHAFPGIPLAVLRDGCVSVRTLQDAEATHAHAQSRMAEGSETSATVTPIAPFWLRIDPNDHDVEFQWIASIGGHTVAIRISQSFKVLQQIGTLHVTYNRYVGGRGDETGIESVRDNKFTVHPALAVIGNGGAEYIRYSSGDRKRPGEHLIYWNSCNGETADATLPMLLDKLTE